MRHGYSFIFAFSFSFVVTGAALLGGQWIAGLVKGTDNPDTPQVIMMTIVCGVVAFLGLSATMSALGMFGAEDKE